MSNVWDFALIIYFDINRSNPITTQMIESICLLNHNSIAHSQKLLVFLYSKSQAEILLIIEKQKIQKVDKPFTKTYLS